jgi:Amt family ammonium transporter
MIEAMFAIITPALIIGSFAERMKFQRPVHAAVGHAVGLGVERLRNLGASFAGGTVVHINAGMAALVTAVIIQKKL